MRAAGGPWPAAVTVTMPPPNTTRHTQAITSARGILLLGAGQQPTSKGAAAKCGLGGVV